VRRDYGDYKPAMERLITRVEAGAWRHGIKTKAAQKELAKYARLPSEPNDMFQPAYRKRVGQILDQGLYYYVQSSFKNRRWLLIGQSGEKLRLRRIFCVEHGAADGEVDQYGLPVSPDREGLWLRVEDLNKKDVQLVREMYRGREVDSALHKRFFELAERKLAPLPDDAVVGDVLDDILDDM